MSEMTAEHRANNVAVWFFQVTDPNQRVCEQMVTREIKEAERIAERRGFERGFAECREEAVDIANAHAKIKGAHIHPGLNFCVQEVAEQIRVLRPDATEGRGDGV